MIDFYQTDNQLKDGNPWIGGGLAVKTTSEKLTELNELSEEEILKLIKVDLADYANPEGSYKTSKRMLDTLSLFDILKRQGWTPSHNMISQLVKMKEQYGDLVLRIINSIDKSGIYAKAEAIANFVGKDEQSVLEKMATREQKEKETRKQQEAENLISK